jgi:mono/diheme cytochrome c family protein
MNSPAIRLSFLLVAAACCAGCWRSSAPPLDELPEAADRSRPDVSKLHTGPELYQALCAACHGAHGAADGPGSQSLYPPARNLREHRFRLISTDNGVPTRADINSLIAQGMPGTSMRAFSELSPAQRELLVDEVLRYRREGMEELLRKTLRAQGELVSDTAVQEQVVDRMTPGTVVVPPEQMPTDSAVVERGRQLYFRQACQACHGADGIGVRDVRLMTDEGVPTRGRDLVHEPFKGGHSPESIYLRIALGMPGTPMPASRTLTPAEVADLVAFCQSLSREPKRQLTNHQRRQLARAQAYMEAFEKGK